MVEKKLHEELINSITHAIKASCETENHVVSKVIDYAHQTVRNSNEPGVELVDSLEKIFKSTIAHAIELKCDLRVIIKGLVIGTYRSSDAIRQEAHKTIAHMVKLIIKIIHEQNGDIQKSMRGLLEGIAEMAGEDKLNLQTALTESASDAVFTASKISESYGLEIRKALSVEIKGVKVIVAENKL